MSGRLTLVHAIHDFLPRHPAGSEIYAFNLCRELSRRHDVTVLCAEHDGARRNGDVAWRVHEGLPVVEVVNNWSGRAFEETYLPPLISQRLEHVLDAIQPDLLHVHSLLNLSFDLPRLAHDRGIPVVATLHDYSLVCPSGGQRLHRAEEHRCDVIDPSRCARCFPDSPQSAMAVAGAAAATIPGPIRRLAAAVHRAAPAATSRIARRSGRIAAAFVDEAAILRRLVRAKEALGAFDLIVAPSTSIASEYIRLGADASRMRVSDYGTPSLAPVRSPGSAGVIRIGYVGTLVWHKGVHVAIDAMRHLPARRFELRVHGDPRTFPDYALDLRARAAGLPVRFMGPFDRGAAAAVYGNVDVVVVPSLWLENSPLVIHEAFMCGVPVVGSKLGGICDLVQHGVNGLLVDPGSPHALAEALTTLAEGGPSVQALAARVPAVKSMAKDAAEWEAAYAEVLVRRAQAERAS